MKKSPAKHESSGKARRPMVLREAAALPGWGGSISVREAKAHLSGLLERVVTTGKELVITSDGKPKVKVMPVDAKPRRKEFPGSAAHLKTMPMRPGPSAEELIRTDREGRGW